MHWIIQANMYSEEGFERLLETLARLELPHSVHKVIPFGGGIDPEPTPVPGPVIVMGTITMAKLAQDRCWHPGSFLNENFDFEIQRKHWGDRMLNFNSVVVPFRDVPFMENPFFVRPTLDSKAFTGQVMDWGVFDTWRTQVLALAPDESPTLTPNTLVQVCPKQEIYRECRVFMVDGKAVTASYYKFGGIKRYDAAVEPMLLTWAEAQAAHWSPARAFVMDVAVVPHDYADPEHNDLYLWGPTGIQYKIIEVNNINSAGWYAADMNKLVLALEGTIVGSDWDND